MGWCPLWKQHKMNSCFLLFWPEDCCCCCHLRRGIGPSWVLLESGLEKTQGSWWVSPGSTERHATGQEMGRTSDLPLSSASPSNYSNSLRLLTAVKAVLRHETCPAITLSAYLPNSTRRLSFQESRHIKSRNLLWQTAELCSLSLPLYLIKSTVAEIVLACYISM